MPNPMENLIDGDQQPSDEEQINQKDSEQEKKEPGLEEMQSTLGSLSSGLERISGQISAIEERMNQEPAEEPIEEETKEEWVPGTWGEVEEKARQQAEEVVNQTLQSKEQEAEERRRAEEEARKVIDEEFDNQLASLEEKEIIPKVENERDNTDPGKLARREIFGYAAVLGTTNLVAVGEQLKREHEAGNQFDIESGQFIKVRSEAPGQNVPVGSSSNRGGAQIKPGLSYKELHDTSMDEIIRRSQE